MLRLVCHRARRHPPEDALVNVIVLTVFVGLVLVSFFFFLFLHQSSDPRTAGGERDALLPLEGENVCVAHKEKEPPAINPS